MKPCPIAFLLLSLLLPIARGAEEKFVTIGWANLQWPPSTNHLLSATNRSPNIYGQVWIDGVTSRPGGTTNLTAQLGIGPAGSDPRGAHWSWTDAKFNVDVGNNDEFVASLLPETSGAFDYVYRYSTTGRSNWLYADLTGLVPAGQIPSNPGKLTVVSGAKTNPPATPEVLVVTAAARNQIDLAWKNVQHAALFGYDVLRSPTSGGPYVQVARVRTNSFTDRDVKAGVSYFYVIRAVDNSFNHSEYSREVSAVAQTSVPVTFHVFVPGRTESPGKSVFLAGTLSELNGSLPEWDPGALMLNQIDERHWTITVCGKPGAQIKYKYTLGSWDHVEKGGNCEEIEDRQVDLTVSIGNPSLSVTNRVLNWRNVAPCKD